MVKVFKYHGYYDGVMSEAEAEETDIPTDGLELVSIEVLKKAVKTNGLSEAYAGKVLVLEGIFEFNYDTSEYELIGGQT